MTWKKFGTIELISILSLSFLLAWYHYANCPETVNDAYIQIDPVSKKRAIKESFERPITTSEIVGQTLDGAVNGFVLGSCVGIFINAGVAATSDN